jgi:hypothetical protein
MTQQSPMRATRQKDTIQRVDAAQPVDTRPGADARVPEVPTREVARRPETEPAEAGPSREVAAGQDVAARPDGTEELRREIERTRRELGDTVAALAAKTDVKARARDTADRMKADMSARGRSMMRQAQERAGSRDTMMIVRRGSMAVAGAAGATLVTMMIVRYRRGARPSIRWQRVIPLRGQRVIPLRASRRRKGARLSRPLHR